MAKYFLGSSSQNGFYTSFDKKILKDENFTYILKGGAGTGKSSFMKKLYEDFKEKDDIDLYFCASDPKSLDAIVFKNSGIIVVDGTSPHIFEPIYPGVSQKLINLGEFWDEDALKKNKETIKLLSNENKFLHKRVTRYISALSQIASDISKISEDAILKDKLDSFISRLSKKLFPKTNKKFAKTTHSQISALTYDGYLTFFENFKDFDNVYLIKDPYFSQSKYILKRLSDIANEKGYDIIISECRLLDENHVEHLIIPELKLCFLSENIINSLIPNNARIINSNRFYDKSLISSKRNRLMFDKKACLELKDEISKTLKKANDIHKELESFYIKAMDFNAVGEKYKEVKREIEKLY